MADPTVAARAGARAIPVDPQPTATVLPRARRLLADLFEPRPLIYWADFLASLTVAYAAAGLFLSAAAFTAVVEDATSKDGRPLSRRIARRIRGSGTGTGGGAGAGAGAEPSMLPGRASRRRCSAGRFGLTASRTWPPAGASWTAVMDDAGRSPAVHAHSGRAKWHGKGA